MPYITSIEGPAKQFRKSHYINSQFLSLSHSYSVLQYYQPLRLFAPQAALESLYYEIFFCNSFLPPDLSSPAKEIFQPLNPSKQLSPLPLGRTEEVHTYHIHSALGFKQPLLPRISFPRRFYHLSTYMLCLAHYCYICSSDLGARWVWSHLQLANAYSFETKGAS